MSVLDLCGYKYVPKEVERIMAIQANPVLMCSSLGIAGSGKGKDVFLFEIERTLTGSIRAPHAQTIGDCVSHGTTGGCEDLEFVQMAIGGKGSTTFNSLSSEVLYGLARHQIGQDKCGSGDGAVVGWAIQAIQQFGVLPRAKYADCDLSVYSGATAKRFGAVRAGPPAGLITESKKYPIKAASAILGPDFYSQAIDVLANGGLVVTGSNQLYGNTRDASGFCKPAGQGGHCTYYRGFSDNAQRPGIAYMQSWGADMPTGGAMTITLISGKSLTLPPGCFFIDAENFNRMHAQGGEVWAVTSMTDFSPLDIDIPFAFY